MSTSKGISLEDAMIAAGIPVALDGDGNLLLDETRHMLNTEGMLDSARVAGSWRVQKLRGRCFAFEGSGCPAGATCVFGPDTQEACLRYIRNNCTNSTC